MNWKHKIYLTLSFLAVLLVFLLWGTGNLGIEATSITIDAVLTVALILLYSGMFSSQEQQRELMEKQTEISELEHQPELRIRSVSAHKADIVDVYRIEVANVGKGVAKDIESKVEYSVDDPDIEIHSEWKSCMFHLPNKVQISPQKPFISGGRSKEILLEAAASVNCEATTGGSSNEVAFQAISNQVSKSGHDILRVKIHLKYESIEGEEKTKMLSDMVVPVDGLTRLHHAIEFGTTYQDHQGRHGFGVDVEALKNSKPEEHV